MNDSSDVDELSSTISDQPSRDSSIFNRSTQPFDLLEAETQIFEVEDANEHTNDAEELMKPSKQSVCASASSADVPTQELLLSTSYHLEGSSDFSVMCLLCSLHLCKWKYHSYNQIIFRYNVCFFF